MVISATEEAFVSEVPSDLRPIAEGIEFSELITRLIAFSMSLTISSSCRNFISFLLGCIFTSIVSGLTSRNKMQIG